MYCTPTYEYKPLCTLCPVLCCAANEDVVQATLYLLSDSSCMITGSSLPVDGGFLAA